MEATQPKVHRQHQRQRRTEARQRRLEREAAAAAATPPDLDVEPTAVLETLESCAAALNNDTASTTTTITTTSGAAGRISAQSSADSIEMVGSPSQTSQQTVVLVNGHAPPTQDTLEESASLGADDPAAEVATTRLESPTQPTKQSDGSRNSSGDAMSLRETLRQLPATHGHRSRRTHSPQSPALRSLEVDSSFHRGILGYIDRELKQSSPQPSAQSLGAASASTSGGGGGASRKQQSLSDPQASPAQRSLRSRNSFDKSPRRKRSKSESRRRRERKLIAAGEMEVRQANETLMRYLKQCSDMHDASLSGELEIDQSLEERRVHRKTKSQRDKRGQLISKLYSAGGLSSILKELADDIAPAEGEEIYNPFTPVVSPTDDTPAHIDKMFLQTSSGYRPVEHSYYKRSFVGAGRSGRGGGGGGGGAGAAAGGTTCIGIDGISAAELGGAGRLFRSNGGTASNRGSYGDTRCLLDAELNRNGISSNIQLACVVQRIWLLISNICHGLLAGLALAHLLFVLSSHPTDWAKVINSMSLAGETIAITTTAATFTQHTATQMPNLADSGTGTTTTSTSTTTTTSTTSSETLSLISDYAGFADMYLNTFYCLAIICLVSVFDRMDICRWSFSNASELISFRWLIITMLYIATIILTICSDSIDEKLYLFNNNANITLTQQELLSNSVQSVWSSLSLTRSIAAISGWIMIGLTPQEDLLYEHLVDLTKYQLTNN
ncbi:GH16354 [Drosophila grimshawi]|uniref:GH16354 n=1 Tax=Drosophila grimshawi TaxID=7222 RepID=B4IYT1_DROGR|nr:GH16354 [Drosophila grimshawi]